jgi:DNA (cytosine-5)-methyltransferase 3A
MKILSLFDGISCGRLALERAGIPVEKYYASEIDKYAIQVAQKNYHDTIQVGDVNKLNYLELLDVDMVIGGSPCQDLSIAKQNRQGLRGERSGLFWKYVEALEVIKPKWFLLENVASMRNEDRDAITETLRKIYPETECIMINSALVSAQQRKRYYWTNWHVEQPQDKGILLKDILENGQVIREGKSHAVISSVGRTTEREYFKKNQGDLVAVPCAMRTREDELGKFKRLETKADNKANSLTSVQTDSMVAEPLVPFVQSKLSDIEKKFGKLPPMFNPYNKQKITDKAPTQTAQCGSQTKSSTVMMFQPVRIGELDGLGKGQANRIYSVRGKSVCLNANGGGGGAKTGLYKVDLPDGDYTIRKLTPLECERLQTLPDGYTTGVSNTQRYKAIGNGWTVDVIAWIFSQLPKD